VTPARLPRDYRVLVVAVALSVSAAFGLRTWVVSIARAEGATVAAIVEKMERKVDALYEACIASGQCRPREAR
jgi:hypothetical protein